MPHDEKPRVLIPAMSPSIIPFLDKVANEFVHRNFEPVLFPQNHEVAIAARSDSNSSDAYHLSLVDHTPEQSLEELTNKYDIPSARSFVFPQMIYEYYSSDPSSSDTTEPGTRYPAVTSIQKPHSYDPFFNWLHKCLSYFDQLFENGKGGHPIQYQGGEIIRRVLEQVSEFHGYQSAWMGFSPIPEKSGFYTDESSEWDSITNASYEELSKERINEAQQYISDFRETKPTVRGEEAGVAPSILRTVVNSAAQLAKQGLDDFPEIWWRLKRQLRRGFMSKYAQHSYLSPSESVDTIRKSDYIFYPLQYYLESRVAMRAPAFYEQSWFIEYLSRSVPVGHNLIVKDHPQQLGAQPRKAVDIISQYATPVSPLLDAHDVIQNSAAVVVLNNTVGYEALLYGKPVITFGHAFYDEYTTHIDDINNIDKKIKNAVDSGGLTEQEVIEFASGLLAGSHNGVWRDTSPDNIQNIVDGYLSVLEE